MKASTFAVASTLAGVSYGAINPKLLTGFASPMMAGGIASAFTKNMVNGGYGKTWSSFGGLPTRVDLPPRQPGSKTVKIRYGPYKVPNMGHKNGLGEGGSMWNYPDIGVTKPCSQCIITGFRAGLEYTDGRVANIDTDAWLHHFVLFNQGSGRKDATCGNSMSSLPHYNVDCTPQTCERLFSSGNERTPAWMSDWGAGKPAGYHLASGDKFSLIVDLMNDSMADKTMYLTITYDYVDGWPSGYDDMRPIWFDVDQCGLSEVEAKSQTGAFTVRAWPWTATMDGEILGYAGHLHDGGQRVVMSVNGAEDCSSHATYGGDPAYIAKGAMGGGSSSMGSMASMLGMNMRQRKRDGGHGATVHISKMSICQGANLKNKMMKKGQSWLLSADYDYSKNPGVKDESGWQASIMGIAIMYVRQPWSGSVGGGGFSLFGRSNEEVASIEAM